MTTGAVIETDRLLLRPPEPGDIPHLFRFLGDPAAMRFTQLHGSIDDCRRYVEIHEAQRSDVGCAPWTVIGKAEQEAVGYGGLYEDPFEPGWGLEVAYFFRPESWGRGYASELVRASLDVAAHEGRWHTIWAFAHGDNSGSLRVLEKTGFDRRRFVAGLQRWLYGRDLAAK